MRTIQNAYPERLTAVQLGEKTYFTGRPCKQGHIAERWTADSGCMECRRQTRLRLNAVGHGAAYMREKRRKMLAEDPDGTRAKWKADQLQERERNPDRVRERERRYGRIKRQRYPQRKLAEVRKRQAAKLQRTPTWADLKAIQAFYENCPAGYEVDHIAPLRGRTVSGLHVLENLQYLPALENRIKNRNFDADTYAVAELERWRTAA